MNQQTVQQIMHKQPITVQCQTPLKKIIEVLLSTQQTQLPVVNSDNKLIGLVSLVDCQKALLVNGYHCDQPIKVNDIMVKDVFTLSADQDVSEVAIKTLERTENVFPVVAVDKLVGIVKRVDLLLLLNRKFESCSVA